MNQVKYMYDFFDQPGLTGVVLQTALLLFDWFVIFLLTLKCAQRCQILVWYYINNINWVALKYNTISKEYL